MRHRLNTRWETCKQFIIDGEVLFVNYRFYKGRILFGLSKNDIKRYNLDLNLDKIRKKIKNEIQNNNYRSNSFQ